MKRKKLIREKRDDNDHFYEITSGYNFVRNHYIIQFIYLQKCDNETKILKI